MGHIPVCLLCCYLVTIRGLDGRFTSVLYVFGVIRTFQGWSGSEGTELPILYKQSLQWWCHSSSVFYWHSKISQRPSTLPPKAHEETDFSPWSVIYRLNRIDKPVEIEISLTNGTPSTVTLGSILVPEKKRNENSSLTREQSSGLVLQSGGENRPKKRIE